MQLKESPPSDDGLSFRALRLALRHFRQFAITKSYHSARAGLLDPGIGGADEVSAGQHGQIKWGRIHFAPMAEPVETRQS